MTFFGSNGSILTGSEKGHLVPLPLNSLQTFIDFQIRAHGKTISIFSFSLLRGYLCVELDED